MIETDQSLGLLTYFFPTDLTWGFLVDGFHWCVNDVDCVAFYNSDSCHCADRVTVCVCKGTILIFNVFLNANNALKSETLNNTHTHTYKNSKQTSPTFTCTVYTQSILWTEL